MKWKVITILIIIILILISLILIKSKARNIYSESEVPKFSLKKVDGTGLIFTKENYSGKLILNFFGTECEFCLAEMNDIISFSKKHDVEVLFVTADSLDSLRNYILQLKKHGINRERISFAQINLQDANKVFGDVIVPQSMILDDGLKIRTIRKGMVSYTFLKNTFGY